MTGRHKFLTGFALVALVVAGVFANLRQRAAQPIEQRATSVARPHIPADRGSIRIIGQPIIRWARTHKQLQFYVYFKLNRRGPALSAFLNGDRNADTNNARPLSFNGRCYNGDGLASNPQSFPADPTGSFATVTVQSFDSARDRYSYASVKGRFGTKESSYQQNDPDDDPEMAAKLKCGHHR